MAALNRTLKSPARVEIFRVGTHTAMNGISLNFTQDDLANIAAIYDPQKHEAPIVIGHPEIDAPAYGWVKALVVENDRLVAELVNLDPDFEELLKARRYAKVSAAFWGKTATGNPIPGSIYLRHVGFLGATPPSVKGLKNIDFSSSLDNVFFFGSLSVQEVENFYQNQMRFIQGKNAIDKLIEEGRFLPAYRNGMIAFLEKLNGTETLEFSEPDGKSVKRSALSFLLDMLSHYGKLIPLGGSCVPDEDKTEGNVNSFVRLPDGYSISPEDSKMIERINALAKEHNMTFGDALTRYTKNG